MKLFNRVARLTVFSRSDISFAPLLFEGFRISFNIEYTEKLKKNTGAISIYNLSSDTYRFFQEQEKLSVILECGYNNNYNKIADCDVSLVSTKRQGVDVITTFKLADGLNALNLTFNKTYSAKIPIKKMAGDLISRLKEAGVSVANDFKNLFSGDNNNSFSFSGTIENALGKLSSVAKLDISITNNELIVSEVEKGFNNEVVLLTKETGLIGDVAIKDKGVEFTCLIQAGLIYPKKLVKITTNTFDNYVLPLKITYQGDTKGQEWYIIGSTERTGKK